VAIARIAEKTTVVILLNRSLVWPMSGQDQGGLSSTEETPGQSCVDGA
jgi:hypothetical protein